MNVAVDAFAKLRALLRVPMPDGMQQQVQRDARPVAEELAARRYGRC